MKRPVNGALRFPLRQARLRGPCLAICLFTLAACLATQPASGEDEVPFARLFDTGVSLAEPLTEELLARPGAWRQVPEDDISHPFTGDAVLLNDKLVVLLKKQGLGPQVYSKMTGRLKHRATLGYAGAVSSPLSSPDGFRIIQNTTAGVVVEASFKGSAPAALRLRLTTGESTLGIQSKEGSGFVEVRPETRYVVVPDYFGDDMVYGTGAARGLFLPAENFCLHLLEGGDAMLMSIRQSSEQDEWLDTGGSRAEDGSGLSRIRCSKDNKVWLAFLESPAIWHAQSGLASDDWKPPFPAKWRRSFVRENCVADSWDMDAGPGPAQSVGKHQGPLISYLLDRSTATPLLATCPTDVMRNTLGVGPCQYILACEGLGAQGDPTPNSVMTWVEKQFEQKKDKKAAEDIKERLEQMVKHADEANSRIQRYAGFALQLRNSPAGKQDQFLAIAADLDRFSAAGLAPAASPQRTRQLAGEVAGLIGKENAFAPCCQLGRELRSIGAAQDHALAKSRMAVRRVRQEALSLAINQPPAAAQALEVQRLAEQFLRTK